MNYFCFVINEFLILFRVLFFFLTCSNKSLFIYLLRILENTAPAINAPPSPLKPNNDVFGRVIDFLMISWQKMIGYEGDYFDKQSLFVYSELWCTLSMGHFLSNTF